MTKDHLASESESDGDVATLRAELSRLQQENRIIHSRLVESEGWLHDVVEGLADGLLVLDNCGGDKIRVAHANSWAAKIFEMSVEELAGKDIFEIIHPDEKAYVVERWQQAKRGEQLEKHTYRARTPSGVAIWVTAKCELVSKSYCGPACTRLISVIQRVSEHHEREEEIALRRLNWALAAQARSLSVLIHSAPVAELMMRVCESIVEEPVYLLACFVVPERGGAQTVKFVAKAGLAVAYPEAVRISWSADDPFGSGPTGRAMRDGIPHIVADTQSDPSYAPWRTGAAEFGIRSSVTVPCVEAGRIAGALLVYAVEPNAFGPKEMALFQRLSDEIGFAMSLDVNRSRLLQAEENLNAAVQFGPGVLYRARLYTDKAEVRDLFGDSNRVVGGFAGAGLDEAQSRAAISAILCVPERIAGIHALEGQAVHTEDYAVEAADGSTCWVRNAVRIAGRGEQGVDVVGYLCEVTQEKQQELRHQKLNTLLTLGEMATGMAHELNQPLASISLTAENALMRLSRTPPNVEDVQNKLHRIMAETARASRLIDHMRIFARNEPTEMHPVAWAVVLEAALVILHGKLRGTRVVKELADDLPRVMGSLIPMEQVLINLISNAIDAYVAHNMRQPWAVTVCGWAEGGQVVLHVKDKAGGVPPLVMGHLFEPFFTTKPPGQGTGLGLAITSDAIAAMGGTITVANDDEGAVFEIRMPIAP